MRTLNASWLRRKARAMSELEDRLGAIRSLRTDQCVSDYELDRLVVGALKGSDASDVETRIAACNHCRERLEAFQTARAEFARRPTPMWLGGRRARRRLGISATIAAAAAAALLLFRPADQDPASIRLKGPDYFGYTIVRPDGTIRGDQDSAMATPGDELQWHFRTSEERYVAVLSRDPVGHISVYYPDGPEAALLLVGQKQALPLALRLDATIGEEELLGLICKTPVQLEPVRSRLQSGNATFPEQCTVRRYTLTKREDP